MYIDNVYALKNYTGAYCCRIMTLKNDSGLYQALVVWCTGTGTVPRPPEFKSVYCNDINQALESLLEVTQEEAWNGRKQRGL